MSVPRFFADWPGECASCGSDYDTGEEAGYVDDEVCCADCCDGADDQLAFEP